MIVALPGLFSYFFFKNINISVVAETLHVNEEHRLYIKVFH